MISELNILRPDILCLQEVEQVAFENLKNYLQSYNGNYKKKPGEKVDGCATFWKKEKYFSFISSPKKFILQKLLNFFLIYILLFL